MLKNSKILSFESEIIGTGGDGMEPYRFTFTAYTGNMNYVCNQLAKMGDGGGSVAVAVFTKENQDVGLDENDIVYCDPERLDTRVVTFRNAAFHAFNAFLDCVKRRFPAQIGFHRCNLG